jgi:hypothetical protein
VEAAGGRPPNAPGQEKRTMKKALFCLTGIAALLAVAAPALAWTSISVPGSIYDQNQWSPGAQPLTNKSGTVWSGVVKVDHNSPSTSETGFKFAADGGWANNWGADYTVWRFPSVGTLTAGGPNLGLTALQGDEPQFLRFTFDESTLRFSVAPIVTSVQLVGAFNNYGEGSPDGTLTKLSGNVWSNTFSLASGANLQLRVNGSDLWGPPGDYASTVPLSTTIAGGGAVQIDGFRPGTFSFVFDADSLTLSVEQLSATAFDAEGIAAEGTINALWQTRRFTPSPQDVNLATNGALYTGDFWIDSASTFTLAFSERDATGNRGGRYWYAPSVPSSPIDASSYSADWLATTDASAVQYATFKAPSPGFYQISLDPASGAVSLQCRYTLANDVNLFKDPSLESGNGWSFFNATRYVAANIGTDYEPPSIHTGSGVASLLQRQTEEGDYGSVSQWIVVSNCVGSTLRVSAWFCAFNGWTADRTRIWIQWQDASENPVGTERELVIGSVPSSWTPFSLEADVPEGAARANILFSYNGANEGDGYLLIDDAEARVSSTRRLNFDTWTKISSSWGPYSSPDWTISRGRTTNNLSDVHLDPGALYISKYIEGSNNNKAVELFNPTTSPINLSGWKLQQYNNGATTPSAEFALSGTVATGACFLVTRTFDDPVPLADTLKTASDKQFYGLTFNGDDAIVLVDPSGNVADRVGQVRSDVTGSLLAYVMRDHTLVRSPYTARGTTNAVTEPFPYSEWEILPCDDFTGLKSHVRALPPDVYIPTGLSLIFAATADLKSPQLEGGIGDVSFWYRTAFPESAKISGSATLVVEASSTTNFAAADTTVLTNIVIPSTQYDFRQFSVLADLSSTPYFRIRSTNVTGNAFARIDDLSVGATLPISRNQNFNSWTNANWAAYVGTYSLGGWTIYDGRVTLDQGLSDSPAAVLPSGAQVASPALDSGAGNVSFWMSAIDPEEDSYTVVLEQSTDGGLTWKNLGTFNGSGVTNWVSRSVSASAAENVSIRFRSTGPGPVMVDNIRIDLPEEASRNQDFNSWPAHSGYQTESYQGWLLTSGAIDTAGGDEDTRYLRLRDPASSIQSSTLQGGLGVLSFYVKPSTADHTAKLKVEVFHSDNSSSVIYSNNIPGSSAPDWQLIKIDVSDETVTAVKFTSMATSSSKQTICLDTIVCGKIVPPPSMAITPALDPAIPYPGEAFRFVSYVNPVGGATQDDIVEVWAGYTFVEGGVPTNGTAVLTQDETSGAWYSSDFPGLADGSRIVFSNVVVWTSNSTEIVTSSERQTVYVSALANSGVWINEVFYSLNATLDGGGWGDFGDGDDWGFDEGFWDETEGHEFIEICGPENTDLTDWRIELQFSYPKDIAYNGGKATYATYRFTANNTTPSSALKLSNQSNGYGFFVVGDPCTNWTVNVAFTNLVPPTKSHSTPALTADHLYNGAGVILLKNKQGVTVHAVSYDSGDSVPNATDIGHQSAFNVTDSLSATGGPGWCGTNFTWKADIGVSAGTVNAGQSFTNHTTVTQTVPYAFHDQGLVVIPEGADAFRMLCNLGTTNAPTVDGELTFYVAFPTNYLVRGREFAGNGLVNYRTAGSGGYDAHPVAFGDGLRSGTNAFLTWTEPNNTGVYPHSRLETIEYYFSFDPDGKSLSYSTAYVAAGENGGTAVYESEQDAAAHPFSYTFPFHDGIEFTSITVPANPDDPVVVVFRDPDYTDAPDTSELSVEALSGDLTDSDGWYKLRVGSVGFRDVVVVTDGSDNEKGTFYTVEIDSPAAPVFFRVAPYVIPAPSPTP